MMPWSAPTGYQINAWGHSITCCRFYEGRGAAAAYTAPYPSERPPPVCPETAAASPSLSTGDAACLPIHAACSASESAEVLGCSGQNVVGLACGGRLVP